ncbi:unnamed protein product, partial [Ectocarpus sp. 12 AP-2014]
LPYLAYSTQHESSKRWWKRGWYRVCWFQQHQSLHLTDLLAGTLPQSRRQEGVPDRLEHRGVQVPRGDSRDRRRGDGSPYSRPDRARSRITVCGPPLPCPERLLLERRGPAYRPGRVATQWALPSSARWRRRDQRERCGLRLLPRRWCRQRGGCGGGTKAERQHLAHR